VFKLLVVSTELRTILLFAVLGILFNEYDNKGFNAIFNVATDGLNLTGYN